VTLEFKDFQEPSQGLFKGLPTTTIANHALPKDIPQPGYC